MKNVFKTHALLLGLAMSCFGFTAAQAAVKTYVGPDGGSWVTGSNWSPAGVPTSADDVVSVGSPSTTILVDYNDLISFNSLTLTSTTLQLKGFIDDGVNITLEAGGIIAQQNDNEPNFNLNQMQTITGDLVIKAGGLLTLDDQGYPPDNQVFFRANNIDIRLNGAVDVSGKGYFGGGTAQRGEGPGAGAGSTGTSQGAGGAGNGGAGGNGLYGALGGGSYCDFSNPRAGSGGGGGPSASNPARGGGLLRLWAINNLNVDGRILANGEAGFAGTDAGGSSGGGIIVQAKTITGSPQAVEANGGSGDTTGGGGAGGCVSFRYSQSTSFSLPSVDVLGGVGAGGAANGSVGQKYYQLSPSSLDYFTVSGVGTTTITTTFGWGGGTETAYSLEQSTDGVNFTQVGLGPTTTAEFGFSNLLAGSYYWLRVGAISPVTGTSTYLMANKVYLPIIPTPITITGVSPTSIGLTFALGLNNPSTTLYNVRLLYPGSYLEFFANGQPALPAATNLNGSQTYLPSQWAGTAYGLTPSTTYDTRIMATDVQYYTAFVGGSTTTLLATPSTPTIGLVSTSTIALTWTQNGNPATTPYAVYNKTLNQYHLANGTLSPTPTFYPLSSWNGSAKGLTPSTKYLFQIVLRNEDGTQNATSTENGTYTNNPDNTPFSLGGSSSGSSSGGASTTASMGSTTSTGWYFGTPGSSTTYPNTPGSTTTTSPLAPTPGGTTAYYLPDGTLITPQLIFQMMMNANNNPSLTFGNNTVSLYKGKNLSSNILFSKFSTQANPLKVGSTLSFRYTYQNPNKTGLYRVERVLLNPQGKVVARSVISSRTITFGQTITYNPSQYFSTTLSTGLYTMRVRITSVDTKTIYDENTFEVSVKK